MPCQKNGVSRKTSKVLPRKVLDVINRKLLYVKHWIYEQPAHSKVTSNTLNFYQFQSNLIVKRDIDQFRLFPFRIYCMKFVLWNFPIILQPPNLTRYINLYLTICRFHSFITLSQSWKVDQKLFTTLMFKVKLKTKKEKIIFKKWKLINDFISSFVRILILRVRVMLHLVQELKSGGRFKSTWLGLF